jgi:F-type H+-transporting ATPase subunit delta
MAELATLARPYASAVFAVAKSEGDLDRWSRMLTLLSAAAADEKIRWLLSTPEVDEMTKAYRVTDVCGDELNDRAKRFVQVLARNKRLPLLSEIAVQFEALRAEEQATLDVEITSAFPLSDAELDRIKAALTRRFDKDINMESAVDRALIGGAVIRAGDTVIDGSVKGKLAKLAEVVQRT